MSTAGGRRYVNLGRARCTDTHRPQNRGLVAEKRLGLFWAAGNVWGFSGGRMIHTGGRSIAADWPTRANACSILQKTLSKLSGISSLI